MTNKGKIIKHKRIKAKPAEPIVRGYEYEGYKTGGKTCPLGMRLQSIIFKKDQYTLAEAKAWLKHNDFKDSVDDKKNTYRFRQESTSHFTYERNKAFPNTKGIIAVYGCPKKELARKLMHSGDKIVKRPHLVGKTVIITDPNKNYNSYRGKEFVVTEAEIGGKDYKNEFYPYAKLDLMRKDTEKKLPFSVYEKEVELIH